MNFNALKNLIMRRLMLVVCATTLAVGVMFSLPQLAHAQEISPPWIPEGLEVELGNEVFLVGHAIGTQNYVCAPCDITKPDCPLGLAFALFTPQATLFNDQGEQLTTHFFSPNPDENSTIRATWQDSRDTSSVWAKLVKSAIVRSDSIAALLLNVKDTGTQAGPTGDRLTKTTFIHRVNTVGGLAPVGGCLSSLDLGRQAFVPYTADYVFYKKSKVDK